MRFRVTINFYKLNDDNTITFFVLDGETKKYYRANGKLPILNLFSECASGDKLDVLISVYYDRGHWLSLEILEII